MSSGNYNPATSSTYTDIGLLTCREDICHDANQIFNMISGYGKPSSFRSLLVAPLTLRTRAKELIDREACWAAQDQAAHMILKMNTLSDTDIAAVITYTRNSWSNHTGEAIQPAEVKAARS